MQHSSDLSVEEILESIKRVIARDNKDVAQTERTRRENDGMIFRDPPPANDVEPFVVEDEDEEEVFDLGGVEAEMIEESEQGAEEAELEAFPEPEVSEQAEEAAMDETSTRSESETSAVEPEITPEEPLELAQTAPEPEDRVRDSLAALAAISSHKAEIAEDDGAAPLERMAREMLRPMLAEWLDANLPGMVEGMVKAEIERILGKPR